MKVQGEQSANYGGFQIPPKGEYLIKVDEGIALGEPKDPSVSQARPLKIVFSIAEGEYTNSKIFSTIWTTKKDGTPNKMGHDQICNLIVQTGITDAFDKNAEIAAFQGELLTDPAIIEAVVRGLQLKLTDRSLYAKINHRKNENDPDRPWLDIVHTRSLKSEPGNSKPSGTSTPATVDTPADSFV